MLRRVLISLILLATFLALGYVAHYPPRRERLHAIPTGNQNTQVETFHYSRSDPTDVDRSIPRVSLFHNNPHYLKADRGSDGGILTEIDTGRLVAEGFLILAVGGAALALLNMWPPSARNPAPL